MPTQVDVHKLYSKQLPQAPIATEQELLAFCNRVREAGGAQVLDALLPSQLKKSETCLIANNLNFGCRVVPCEPYDEDRFPRIEGRSSQWFMLLPDNLRAAIVKKVAEAVWRDEDGAPGDVVTFYAGSLAIKLPEVIGNSAQAFDQGIAFTRFVQEDNQRFTYTPPPPKYEYLFTKPYGS